MAVLALTNGTPEQRVLARKGASWLMTNPGGWVRAIEPDLQLQDRPWSIMSFSLGLRAVLHPRIGIEATNPVLEPAIASSLCAVGPGDGRMGGVSRLASHNNGLLRSGDRSACAQACSRVRSRNCICLVNRGAMMSRLHLRRSLLLRSRCVVPNRTSNIQKRGGQRSSACKIPGATQWKLLQTIARSSSPGERRWGSQAVLVNDLARALWCADWFDHADYPPAQQEAEPGGGRQRRVPPRPDRTHRAPRYGRNPLRVRAG